MCSFVRPAKIPAGDAAKGAKVSAALLLPTRDHRPPMLAPTADKPGRVRDQPGRMPPCARTVPIAVDGIRTLALPPARRRSFRLLMTTSLLFRIWLADLQDQVRSVPHHREGCWRQWNHTASRDALHCILA